MQYVGRPTELGFYWFKRAPYTKGFWWQKKVTVVPDWEMCYVNTAGMSGNFAVVVGSGTKLISFSSDVDWYGPIPHPEDLEFLLQSAKDLKEIQDANLERARTD